MSALSVKEGLVKGLYSSYTYRLPSNQFTSMNSSECPYVCVECKRRVIEGSLLKLHLHTDSQ